MFYNIFLQGTLRSETNKSLIKYLPQDILYKIWNEYALTIPNDIIIEKCLYDVISIKLEKTENKCELVDEFIRISFEKNKIKAIKYLYEKKYIYDKIYVPESILNKVVRSEDIYFLNIIKNVEWNQIIKKAVSYGSLKVLQYINESIMNVRIVPFIADYAVICCHIDIIDWLKIPFTETAIEEVIKKGKLDILEYLHSKYNIRLTRELLNIAIYHNRIKIVKWLIKVGSFKLTYIPIYIIDRVIFMGNFRMLRYIYSINKDFLSYWIDCNITIYSKNKTSIKLSKNNKTIKWLNKRINSK